MSKEGRDKERNMKVKEEEEAAAKTEKLQQS